MNPNLFPYTWAHVKPRADHLMNPNLFPYTWAHVKPRIDLTCAFRVSVVSVGAGGNNSWLGLIDVLCWDIRSEWIAATCRHCCLCLRSVWIAFFCSKVKLLHLSSGKLSGPYINIVWYVCNEGIFVGSEWTMTTTTIATPSATSFTSKSASFLASSPTCISISEATCCFCIELANFPLQNTSWPDNFFVDQCPVVLIDFVVKCWKSGILWKVLDLTIIILEMWTFDPLHEVFYLFPFRLGGSCLCEFRMGFNMFFKILFKTEHFIGVEEGIGNDPICFPLEVTIVISSLHIICQSPSRFWPH